ncbi:hypothetical protein BGZ97_006425 [Linnemannia gamsii]|uniref:Striatin N-terminal domain-containing protein n=1 Tax=Linnemannia gamsii TaxID=64522 RepID=A0A9P6QRM8_9FUNG|nr:hypothetical protein BGZ97_006425 [Linnemannia gamsii]
MHQFQSFTPSQPPTAAEYAFPSVLQFLQSEWRRFERDRNEWDIEKSEMKARIAFLEGEKRGVDNSKIDLMKRVKMLEFALRQERSKYVEAKDDNSVGVPAQGQQPLAQGVTPSHVNTKIQNRMSTYGQNMTQVSPTSATPGLDPLGRAKSREFLRICLQEISYLTASVPQSIASAMPPAPTRLVRNESDRRAAAAAGGRNRKSDYFPATQTTSGLPPPLNRASSVPLSTLQSFGKGRPTANSPPAPIIDEAEDATLRQFTVPQSAAQPASNRNTKGSEEPTRTETIVKPAPLVTTNMTKPPTEKMDSEKDSSDDTDSVDEEPVTVVHSPLSGDDWHAKLQRAGQQLSLQSKPKKASKSEDDVQLTKDVQDKFNISPERLNKMVKEWDKTKQDGVGSQRSMRKKKAKDSALLGELANLTVNEAETDMGTRTGDSATDEPARWRPKIALKRHLDTVRSIAFHPTKKAILSGSEDGTMKFWNLEAALGDSRKPAGSELDPIHTYRGHTKGITAVALSADQNKCFSASLDRTVRAYGLVPMNKETYARLDPSLNLSTFVGHTDAVWDIRLFPLSISSSQLLGSISADGTVKIWDTETKGSPLKSSWSYHGSDASSATASTGPKQRPVPTGLDFCPTDLKKMVVSYSNSVIKLFDIETGKDILTFKSNETYDGTTGTQINKVICHPTLPVVVSGHEDRYIRFFDLKSGACSYSMLTHLDAVSSLDIDPAGLVLCSGGHDASVRLWDIASTQRTCLQEFTGHRRKGSEGVCAVQYHPTMPELLATGGADSIVKIYTRC